MKTSKSTWIDLQAGAAGLDGPFLEEFHRPYSIFRNHDSIPVTDVYPQIIMAIGDTSKRLLLRKLYGLNSNDNEKKIHLRQIYSRQIIVADCELHLISKMDKILGGPILGDHTRRPIRNIPSDIDPPSLANRIYSQLLSPFSTLICFFADDFGSSHAVASFLASWLIFQEPSDLPTAALPKVLVLKEWDRNNKGLFDPILASKKFKEELAWETRCMLSGNERNNSGLTPIEFQRLVKQRFSDVNVLVYPPYSGNDKPLSPPWATLKQRIEEESNEVQKCRRKAHYAFSSNHLETFLHAACHHFASHVNSPFNFIKTSRLRNPIPRRLSFHLQDFLRRQKVEDVASAIPIIASALCIDSYPPGMHYFEPSSTFQELYSNILQDVQRGLYYHFSNFTINLEIDTRLAFLSHVQTNFDQQTSSAESHRVIWNKYPKFGKSFRSDITCHFCILRELSPENRLSCDHFFCDSCIRIHGEPVSTEPWIYKVETCPICRLQNQSQIKLKPYTAGIRILNIDSHEDTGVIAQFLQRLQTRLGIIDTSISEHFDIVTGTGNGITLALNVCKELALNDYVKYAKEIEKAGRAHRFTFRSILKPNFNSKRSLESLFEYIEIRTKGALSPMPHISSKIVKSKIVRGKSEDTLQWLMYAPMASLFGPDTLIRDQKIEWSNSDRLPDVLVSCQSTGTTKFRKGGAPPLPVHPSREDEPLFNWMAENLLASLFYLELANEPLFYESPIVCQLQIRCRLPAGPGLIDLLMQFRSQQKKLYYKSNEQEFRHTFLCDASLWQNIRNGGAYLKSIQMDVLSEESLILVRVESLTSEQQLSISNCPYKLKTLIQDQGMDCVFGHRDHRNRFLKGERIGERISERTN